MKMEWKRRTKSVSNLMLLSLIFALASICIFSKSLRVRPTIWTRSLHSHLMTRRGAKGPEVPLVPKVPYTRTDGTHLVECFEDKYHELLDVKVQKLKELCQSHYQGPVDVFESKTKHFRMRANFNIYRDEKNSQDPNGLHYIMYDGKTPCEVTSFPRGTVLLNKLMTDIMNGVREHLMLHVSLCEVRIVTTSSDDSVIVLIYRKPLTQEWKELADKLADKLNTKIVGRSKSLKLIAGTANSEIVEEKLTVFDQSYYLYHTEGAFSQPNAHVCEKMLQWAVEVTKDSKEQDLLELYCGGGTFTLPLSVNFKNVLATELSKQSVELADMAIKKNNIKNIKIARLSSEEFTNAYVDNTNFRRLHEKNIDLKQYNIGTVFVDPPRAGLDPATCLLLSRFNKIVYISCNPETLARDIAVLSKTHHLVKLAAFDQFPYTHHLEAGALLVRHDPEGESSLGKRKSTEP